MSKCFAFLKPSTNITSASFFFFSCCSHVKDTSFFFFYQVYKKEPLAGITVQHERKHNHRKTTAR